MLGDISFLSINVFSMAGMLYTIGTWQVFLAKMKWSPEQFAVKQMTLKDSDHIDKQEEVR